MKLPPYRNGLIYYPYGTQKSSAVVFNNDLVLTTGLTLLQVPNNEANLGSLPQNELICVENRPEFQKPSFKLILENGKDKLTEQGVQIAFVLRSSNVESFVKQNFSGLKFLVDGDYRLISEYSQHYATFLFLKPSYRNLKLPDVKESFQSIVNNTINQITTLDEIVCISAPFGSENFINSVSYGHVANTFGTDNCLMLLNLVTTFGCDGAGVYDQGLNLRGLLLGSTFAHQNDNVSFSLAINVNEILKVLFTDHCLKSLPKRIQTDVAKSVCMIDSMGCWGTGCLFQMKNRQFVLTCSHVLSSNNIVCHVKDEELELKLLYKNPIFDSAYDLALLEVSNKSKPNKANFCQLANYQPKIGQPVYSVGFPLFKSFGWSDNFRPTIYRGRVTKHSVGILFTDCPVQAGQSGGPLFDDRGDLLAVMVSNFKSALDDRIYPWHNMCVPVWDLHRVLEEYCETNDLKRLTKLQASNEIVNKWKIRRPKITSRL
ncbi:peroxisomal leader peptide-processing protease [Culex quinquefasciatus]|nr:peroxisomal leader peptide-processing protease [Culex quinquefasciatus]